MMRRIALRPSIFWLLLAVTLQAGALFLLLANPPDALAAIPWLASLVLLLIALASGDRRVRSFRICNWIRRGWSRGAWREVLLVAAVTLLGLALRATALDSVPPGMHGDEGEMGLLALDLLKGTRSLSPFTTGWMRHPTMIHYWQAASMGVFGEDLVGLRMLSAVAGTLSIPLLYVLVRLGFGRWAGLVSASLLASSHLHIHFSRLALNNIESSTLLTLTLLLITLAVAKRSHVLWGVAGLAAGYGLYFYFGSQIVLLISITIIARLTMTRELGKGEVAGFALGLVFAVSPLLLHYAQNPQIVSERTRGVFLLAPGNLQHTVSGMGWPEGASAPDILAVLSFQLGQNLRFYLGDGDASSFYLRDIAAFDFLSATLLWLGMVMSLTRPLRLHEFVLLTWFWSVFLIGGVLTRDAPNAPRLLMAVPAVFAFGGVLVGRGRVLLNRAVGLRLDPAVAAVLVVLGAAMLRLNFESYFDRYRVHAPWQGVLAMANEMKESTDDHRMYLIGAPQLFARHGVLRFVALDVEVTDCIAVTDCLPLDLRERGAIFFVLPARLDELSVIEAQYPRGSYEEERDNLGRFVYASYSIPAVS